MNGIILVNSEYECGKKRLIIRLHIGKIQSTCSAYVFKIDDAPISPSRVRKKPCARTDFININTWNNYHQGLLTSYLLWLQRHPPLELCIPIFMFWFKYNIIFNLLLYICFVNYMVIWLFVRTVGLRAIEHSLNWLPCELPTSTFRISLF